MYYMLNLFIHRLRVLIIMGLFIVFISLILFDPYDNPMKYLLLLMSLLCR